MEGKRKPAQRLENQAFRPSPTSRGEEKRAYCAEKRLVNLSWSDLTRVERIFRYVWNFTSHAWNRKDDSEHSCEEVAQTEKTLNGAATQILKVFKCGEDWGHEARLKSACGAKNNEIPSLNQLVKDHKATLKTCPVCRARQAPNGNLGELLCTLLDPFVQEADRDNRTEVKSTEELCSDLKATNDRILEDGVQRGRFQRAGNLVVGSKDVEAFYPNMDVDLAAEEVKLEVEESNVDIEMDTLEAGLYIACTMTPEEIEEEGLTHVVHKRRYKTGPRPGLTCKAVVGGASQRLEDQAWIQPARRPEGGRRRRWLDAF